jgi:hypothetical protein
VCSANCGCAWTAEWQHQFLARPSGVFPSMDSTRPALHGTTTTAAHASESESAAAKQQHTTQTRVTRRERARAAPPALARSVVVVVLTGVLYCARGDKAINNYPTAWVRDRAVQFCGHVPPTPPRTRGTVQYLCDNDRLCGGFGDRLRGMTQLWIDAMDESADFEALWVSGLHCLPGCVASSCTSQ